MIGRKRRSFSITDFIGAATFYGARFGRSLTRAAAIRGVSVHEDFYEACRCSPRDRNDSRGGLLLGNNEFPARSRHRTSIAERRKAREGRIGTSHAKFAQRTLLVNSVINGDRACKLWNYGDSCGVTLRGYYRSPKCIVMRLNATGVSDKETVGKGSKRDEASGEIKWCRVGKSYRQMRQLSCSGFF